jgi:gamma-glutamyltranspeptidase
VLAPPILPLEQARTEFEAMIGRLEEKYKNRSKQIRTDWAHLRDKYREQVGSATSPEEIHRLGYELMQAKPYLRAQVRGQAAVSSAHPLASAAGTEILRKGGNVVDAAIAVSFAIGVVEPDASGLGGYGEMMIYLPERMESPTCIEFLTRVPEAASLDNGKLNPLPRGGPVMVNVPGTVAGMELAWKKYGSQKVSWSELISPAIRLAEDGFILDASLATTLRKEADQFRKYEGSRQLFFRNGEPLKVGDRLRNPDLAWTLRQIAKGGARAFYE